MFQKLDEVEKRYEELTVKISDPEVISKTNEWQHLMKEHADMTPIVEKYREYKNVVQSFPDSASARSGSPPSGESVLPVCCRYRPGWRRIHP